MPGSFSMSHHGREAGGGYLRLSLLEAEPEVGILGRVIEGGFPGEGQGGKQDGKEKGLSNVVVLAGPWPQPDSTGSPGCELPTELILPSVKRDSHSCPHALGGGTITSQVKWLPSSQEQFSREGAAVSH